MKILYIIHQYWPKYQAGSENYTHYLAEAMAELGHEVFIVAVEPQSQNDHAVERYEEGKVHILKIHKAVKVSVDFDGHYNDPVYEKVFSSILDEIAPDVVHIQHLMYTSLGIVKLIKERGIPVFFTLHDLWIECLRVTKLDYKNRVCEGWGTEKCMRCYQSTHVHLKSKRLTSIANVVNTHLKGTPFYGWVARAAQKVINMGNASSENANDLIQGRYDRMKEMTEFVDLFISPSEFLRQSFITWGIDAHKIIFSRNGMHVVSQTHENSDQKKSEEQKKVCRFVFTSQVREHKGVDVLLDAFEALERQTDRAELLIYGKYDEKSIYGKKFIKKVEKLKHVTYKGSFDNTQINHILHDADYLILPSIWPENAPLVIEEAYLNHVPCIVSNIGGMAERVENQKNGLHFRVNDAQDLSQKVLYVTQNPDIREHFIAQIPHVKTIKENAQELDVLYANSYPQKQTN